MFSLKNFETYMMGVINITPNSFSDPGINNTLENFISRFKSLQKMGVEVIDIGAESTAPFNNPIGAKKEIARFEETYLTFIKDNNPGETILSFDTYKPEVFRHLYDETKKLWPASKIIWNDVSGVLDNELLGFLLDQCPGCYYVYSHTLVKERSRTSFHMKEVMDCPLEDCASSLYDHFLLAREKFKQAGLENRIIYDPCFGFSKNFEQNMQLIKDIGQFIRGELAESPWLLGISRKSFLQKSLGVDLKTKDGLMQVEALHRQILSCWFEQFKKTDLIIRLHDPRVYQAALLAKD